MTKVAAASAYFPDGLVGNVPDAGDRGGTDELDEPVDPDVPDPLPTPALSLLPLPVPPLLPVPPPLPLLPLGAGASVPDAPLPPDVAPELPGVPVPELPLGTGVLPEDPAPPDMPLLPAAPPLLEEPLPLGVSGPPALPEPIPDAPDCSEAERRSQALTTNVIAAAARTILDVLSSAFMSTLSLKIKLVQPIRVIRFG